MVSILLGHPTYYPRFGYHTHAFGAAWAQARPSSDELSDNMLDVRDPMSEDVPALQELWHHEEEAVDMALEPGPDLLDWLSPNFAIQATVYTYNREVVGYTRIHAHEPTKPRVFLAQDGEIAQAMLTTMASKLGTNTPKEVEYTLPLHPFSASVQAFGHTKWMSWDAAMARSLGPSSLDDYLASVQDGRHPPGRVTWPVAFDLG
jgi:putative acetyltransferase